MLHEWITFPLLLSLVGFHAGAAVECEIQDSFLKFPYITYNIKFPYSCDWSFNHTVASNKQLLICHQCIASINCTADFCELKPTSNANCEGFSKHICGVFSNPGSNCTVKEPTYMEGLCQHNQIPRTITMRFERSYKVDIYYRIFDCNPENGTNSPRPICDAGGEERAPRTIDNNNKARFPIYVPVIVVSAVLLIAIVLAGGFYLRLRHKPRNHQAEESVIRPVDNNAYENDSPNKVDGRAQSSRLDSSYELYHDYQEIQHRVPTTPPQQSDQIDTPDNEVVNSTVPPQQSALIDTPEYEEIPQVNEEEYEEECGNTSASTQDSSPARVTQDATIPKKWKYDHVTAKMTSSPGTIHATKMKQRGLVEKKDADYDDVASDISSLEPIRDVIHKPPKDPDNKIYSEASEHIKPEPMYVEPANVPREVIKRLLTNFKVFERAVPFPTNSDGYVEFGAKNEATSSDKDYEEIKH